MSDTDLQLLARYARHYDNDAFAEIVRRHLDLVHSAGLRQVRSPQLAEEVAQVTFIKLARHARQLAPNTILTAWLYQVTRREAIDVVRREARRQLREQIATGMNAMNATTTDWTHIEPLLDEAMHALDDTDRAAVLLRYFENKSLREVGATLGTSDNAARKRVNRAVERLREFFAKRGVTVGASGLVVVISTNAVQAAPVGLAVTISTAAALGATTLATPATVTATKAIAMTTLQKVVITATLAAAVGTGIYEARQAVNSRTQVEALRQQQSPLSEQIRQLTHERDDANRKFASVQEENERLNRNTSELLKLRAELTRLRGDAKELASSKSDPFVESALAWKARVAELKQRLAQMPDQSIPQLQLLGEEDWFDVVKHLKLDTEVGFRRALGRLRGKARGDVSGLMSMALVQYVRANGGELPGDIPQLKPYFKAPMDDAILQQYQLLHTGKLNDVPQGQWLINEKTPLEDGFDTTFRVGYDKFGVERSGPLEEALGRFYEANPGQEPTDPSQLLPYVKDPLRK